MSAPVEPDDHPRLTGWIICAFLCTHVGVVFLLALSVYARHVGGGLFAVLGALLGLMSIMVLYHALHREQFAIPDWMYAFSGMLITAVLARLVATAS